MQITNKKALLLRREVGEYKSMLDNCINYKICSRNEPFVENPLKQFHAEGRNKSDREIK